MKNKKAESLIFEDGSVEKLQESFDAFFQCSLTPLVLLDARFNFIRVNTAYAQACSRNVDEFAGCNHFELYPNEENQQIFEDVVRTSIPYTAKAKPFIFKDHPEWGVTYWDWTLTPILDKVGKVNFLVFSLVDVTSLKLAQIKLNESNELLKTVVAAAPIVLFAVDKNGVFTFAEGSKFLDLKVDPQELIGKSIFEYYADQKDVIEGITQAMSGVFKTMRVSSFKGFVFDVKYSQIKDAGGEIVGIIGVANDVTEVVEAEEELAAHQDRLRSLTTSLVLTEERQRHKMAEELHEYMGPLLSHSIRELSQIQKSVSPNLSKSLHRINECLKDAITRTRDMTFNLSPPSLHSFGLEFAIEELVEKFSKTNGVEYDYNCSGNVKNIKKETQVLLFRSVSELLLNIEKHSNADKIRIEIVGQGNNIKITVSDNGVGFNVSELNSPSKRDMGFGIFSILERLNHIGGNAEIKSQVGQGTEVILLAPLDG